MKALYRKYRPLRLEDVVGQAQVIEPLLKSLEQGKVGHAYLFTGPRGTGKTSVARILAHRINDFPYSLEDEYVDIIEIDGASNRGIDDVRDLREKVLIAPTAGKYKVYIIDEVHMFTREAFNALLKTLEEPPEHAVFIMATTDAHKVPVTITSRAQTFAFKLSTPEQMFSHLKAICEKEGIKISDAALRLVVKRGGGSFRDSLSLLDQISTISDEEITEEMATKVLGLPDSVKVQEILAGYISQDVVKITTILRDALSTGIKPETLTEEIIRAVMDNPTPETIGLLGELVNVKAPFAEAKLLVALVKPAPATRMAAATAPAAPRAAAPTRPPIRPVAPTRPMIKPEIPAKDESPVATSDAPAAVEYPQTSTPSSASDFDVNGFLQNVRALNEAVYMQAAKSRLEMSVAGLNVYTDKKIAYTILSREGNKRILSEAAGGVKVTIYEPGATGDNSKNDALISKISDIMGGEVKNDGGDNPF